MTPEDYRQALARAKADVDACANALEQAKARLSSLADDAWRAGIRAFPGYGLRIASPGREVDIERWTIQRPDDRWAWEEWQTERDKKKYVPKPTVSSVKAWASQVYGEDGAEAYVDAIASSSDEKRVQVYARRSDDGSRR